MTHFSHLVSTAELESRLGQPEWRIMDCRFDLMNPAAGRQAWLSGHIPGAVYADLDRDLAAPVNDFSGRHPLPDVASISDFFGTLGVDGDTNVVCYDAAGGAIAARAWWLLRWLGHEHVAVLDGGLSCWVDEGRPLEAGAVSVAARVFTAGTHDERVLHTQEVVAASPAIDALRLIDARDSKRFRGEIEPIDSVAGHIPGSANLPFNTMLTADGRWQSGDELKRQLQSVIGSDPDVDWAVMCGSGVTACHLALSGLLAGYREPRLYVGSWSEWIRDPDRSVATGT